MVAAQTLIATMLLVPAVGQNSSEYIQGVHFASPDDTPQLKGTCGNYAADSDITSVHQEQTLKDLCAKVIGCGDHLDAWHTNQDGYETCISHGETSWSGGSPKTGAKQLDCQTVTNNADQQATMTVTLDGSHADQVTVGLTETAQFTTSIAVQVSVPEVMQVTATDTFSISSTSTEQHSETNTAGHSNQVSAPVPAHSSSCATMVGNTVDYRQTFEVPVTVTGWIRCQYSSKCNDHYYWYVNLEQTGTDISSSMKGVATSSTVTEVKSQIDDGECPAGCQSTKVFI